LLLMFYHHNRKQFETVCLFWLLNEDISLFDGEPHSLEDSAEIHVFSDYQMEKQLNLNGLDDRHDYEG